MWSAHGYYDPLLRAAEPLIGCVAALLGRHRGGRGPGTAVCGWLPLPLLAVLAAAEDVPLAGKLLGVAALAGVLVAHLGSSSRSAPARLRLPIPLGGNSNHFRTSALCELGAWDPFNLTEDADLGMRIARHTDVGSGVRMLNSVTEEEANSQLGNWLRQRSRWIKGHMQTWLVHTRSPLRLLRELGPLRFCALHLTLGFPILTALINPLLWLLSATWLFGAPAWSAALLPPPVYLAGLFGLIVGYLATVTQLVVACRRRGARAALGAVTSVPLYWLLTTIAAYKGLIQLLRPSRRHYWELTRHGLVDE